MVGLVRFFWQLWIFGISFTRKILQFPHWSYRPRLVHSYLKTWSFFLGWADQPGRNLSSDSSAKRRQASVAGNGPHADLPRRAARADGHPGASHRMEGRNQVRAISMKSQVVPKLLRIRRIANCFRKSVSSLRFKTSSNLTWRTKPYCSHSLWLGPHTFEDTAKNTQ